MDMGKEKRIRKKRKRTKAGNMLCFIIEILVLIMLAVMLFLGYKYYRMGHLNIVEQDLLTGDGQIEDETEEEYLILFLNEEKELDDLLIYADVDVETGRIQLLAIHAEEVFETLDGQWLSCRAIFASSSAAELCSLLNLRLNLHMKDYFTVESEVLVKLTNLLGGADVNLSESEADAMNTYGFIVNGEESDLGPGAQKLSGEQALLYIRNAGYGDMEELMRRFELVCGNLFKKWKNLDIQEQNTISDQFLYSVQTTLSFWDFLHLLKGFGKYSVDTFEEMNMQNNELFEIIE